MSSRWQSRLASSMGRFSQYTERGKLTKHCEICGRDIQIRLTSEEFPIILMYQAADAYLTNKGKIRIVNNHKIKYLCQICRINEKTVFGKIIP